MLNYWWVTRPKRKLDSIPEVLSTFADLSLNQAWEGQRGTQLQYEEALERAGLKRVGLRRDQSGSGARTYQAWLESLGLVFHQESTGRIQLTLAGEAIINGDSPVEILKNQVLKYQFPSAFSVSRGVQVNSRFRVHPFIFLLRLMMDERIGHISQDELAKVVAVEAESDTTRCYEYVVGRLLDYRQRGDESLDADFLEKYKPSRGIVNPDHPFSHLEDMANTMINWMEYTQLAKRDEDNKWLQVLPDKAQEVQSILTNPAPFIDRPDQHEYYQRKYGLDPKHRKDTRNLENTKTVTADMILAQKIKSAYISLSLKQPINRITRDVVETIAEITGAGQAYIEDVLCRTYPHGSVGAFMASYFEMAFHGRDDAVDFEKATTKLFSDIFGYHAIHLGQTGSQSAPDILLISDGDGYQSIIDNKAYSKYSITGDHHNRMVHNYIERIGSYSQCNYPIGYFSYIAGGFAPQIDRQIRNEVEASGVHGSGITVGNFIAMIEKQSSGEKVYSHGMLREIFGLDRQILLTDI